MPSPVERVQNPSTNPDSERHGDRQTPAYRPGRRDTVMHMLGRAVDAHGGETFLIIGDDSITYREIDARANKLGHSLASLGLAKGDRVVTIFNTSIDAMICWLAINKIGGIWVPINTAYRDEFLRHQLNDAGARLLICDPVYLERVVAIAASLPDLQLILCRGDGPYLPCSIPVEPFENYRGEDATPLPIVVEPSDLACLIYTSGTTGPSKGCMISHNYMCMQGRQQRRAVPQSRDEVGWTPLPLFHAAALNLVLGALVEGLRVAVAPRFSVTGFWDDIEKSGASNALLMASIFPLVAYAPENDAMKRCFGQLKMIFGQPITPEVRKIWQDRFGVKTVSGWAYGQTEGSRLTMVLPDETPPETSAGRITDEFEMMIVDDSDQPVADGTVGELVYRPREPNVMFEGYWRRPEATAQAWRNLWMHSGDLARIENGYLYFMDRAKDYLRCRGENISSFEIERTYITHPDIQEVAVHAIGKQTGEDEIKVTIVLREGASLPARALCEWSIEKLPHFAVPRFYEFRGELPKNPTGRILKYRLREEGVTSSTWDREKAGIIVRRRG